MYRAESRYALNFGISLAIHGMIGRTSNDWVLRRQKRLIWEFKILTNESGSDGNNLDALL